MELWSIKRVSEFFGKRSYECLTSSGSEPWPGDSIKYVSNTWQEVNDPNCSITISNAVQLCVTGLQISVLSLPVGSSVSKQSPLSCQKSASSTPLARVSEVSWIYPNASIRTQLAKNGPAQIGWNNNLAIRTIIALFRPAIHRSRELETNDNRQIDFVLTGCTFNFVLWALYAMTF